jgi:hypothetical protein
VVLGAALARGRRRAVYVGASLFGVGYMILILSLYPEQQTGLHLVSNQFLNGLLPRTAPRVRGFTASSGHVAAANARIVKALEQPVSMRFPDETPLGDILKYIQANTHGPNEAVIPIYVEPIGLQEAEKSMGSSIALDLEGVPLKVTLHLALAQLGLDYNVRDGLVLISSETRVSSISEDPFLLVGHCLLALLSAGLGSLLALLVSEPRAERNGRAPSDDAAIAARGPEVERAQ